MTRMISQTWVFKVFHFCFHDFKGKQLINLQQNQTRPSIFDRAAVIYCPEKKKKKRSGWSLSGKISLQPTFTSRCSDVALESAARLVLPPDWAACRKWAP